MTEAARVNKVRPFRQEPVIETSNTDGFNATMILGILAILIFTLVINVCTARGNRGETRDATDGLLQTIQAHLGSHS